VRQGLDFPGARAKNSLIQEHQRDPLNVVHFFESTQFGIEVKASRNGLLVERVVAAQPFGRAGVRMGDQVVAVDGTTVDSAQAFRRVLRQRMGDSNPVLLDVRREDKPLRIEVRCLAEAP
jgi:S1-C subfamily serine protease